MARSVWRPVVLATVLACAAAAAVVAGAPPASAPSAATYVIEPASRFDVITGKAGLLKVFGHTHTVRAHEFSGTLQLDAEDVSRSSVELTVRVAGLQVVPEGADKRDKEAVEQAMFSSVLHPETHPVIRFVSRAVQATEAGVRIDAELTLEGVTRPVSVDVVLTRDGPRLTAAGRFSVRQTEFGIKPYATAGGTVKVADRVTFDFEARAVRAEALAPE